MISAVVYQERHHHVLITHNSSTQTGGGDIHSRTTSDMLILTSCSLLSLSRFSSYRMEPLIKLNNKNNLFDCPIHKTTAELLNGNQQQSNSQQYSVYYLSSHRSHQQQIQSAKKQQSRNKGATRRLLDAEAHQSTLSRSKLLIL
jgi:hypothetical protein